MKFKIYVLIFFSLCNTFIFGQQYRNIFIMVDCSGTIVPQESFQAKEVLKELLLGKKISNNNFLTQSGYSLKFGYPLIASGSNLYIIPFGNKLGKNFHFPQLTIYNTSTDVDNFVESNYPNTFSDAYTYLNLTAAQIAEYAKNSNMNNYLLIIISDFRKDTGPNLSVSESKLLDSIAKKDTGAVSGLVASIEYEPHSIFGLKFYDWDLTKWRKHGSAPPILPGNQPQSENCEISLLALKGGKENKPIEIENENMTISWTINCQTSTNYLVLISGMDGNDFKERKIVTGTFYNVRLDDGKYRITVSANLGNDPTVIIKPATTYIEVSTGSSIIIWFLLILLLLSAGGYYTWKNKLFNKSKEKISNSKTTDW